MEVAGRHGPRERYLHSFGVSRKVGGDAAERPVRAVDGQSDASAGPGTVGQVDGRRRVGRNRMTSYAVAVHGQARAGQRGEQDEAEGGRTIRPHIVTRNNPILSPDTDWARPLYGPAAWLRHLCHPATSHPTPPPNPFPSTFPSTTKYVHLSSIY